MPTTVTTIEHPHVVDAGETAVPGSIDGVSGYTFNVAIEVFASFAGVPDIQLGSTPKPPFSTGNRFGSGYYLVGPLFNKLISDVPNPTPECFNGFVVCNDILTFQFIPGEYALYGFGPTDTDHASDYTLDISSSSPEATTPEPPAALFMLTGLSGLAIIRLRRRPAPVTC